MLTKISKHALKVFILLFFSSAVLAEPADNYNRISFNSSAETEIPNDLLVVTMSARSAGDNLQKLSDDVNKTMKWALQQAKKQPEVKFQTLNYSTSPRYSKGKQTGWQVTQSLKLSSTDTASIVKLMGKLQQQLQTGSVSYQVTPEAREQTEQELTKTALNKFSQQADQIRKTLQRSSYKIVAINIGGNHQQPRPLMAMSRMLEADAMAAPAIEAGSQTVKVTISGTIELSEQ